MSRLSTISLPRCNTVEDVRNATEIAFTKLIGQLERVLPTIATDAGGSKIANVGRPSQAMDAVNLQTLRTELDKLNPSRTTTNLSTTTISSMANSALFAAQQYDLTVTYVNWLNATGATVTLDRNGLWLVMGVFDFGVITADSNGSILGGLEVGGTVTGGQALLDTITLNHRQTVAQQWLLPITTQPTVLQLQAKLIGGTTASAKCYTPNTTLSAVWIA